MPLVMLLCSSLLVDNTGDTDLLCGVFPDLDDSTRPTPSYKYKNHVKLEISVNTIGVHKHTYYFPVVMKTLSNCVQFLEKSTMHTEC